MTIAIIGAGFTGCLVAKHLLEANIPFHVFEKSRGRGGRLSNKRPPWGEFDAGAAVVPASLPAFNQFMQTLVTQGLAHQWPQQSYIYTGQDLKPETRQRQTFVFSQKMSSICQAWLTDEHLSCESLLTSARFVPEQGWQLCVNEHWQTKLYTQLVLTAPWPQTRAILNNIEANTRYPDVLWSSCWSIGFKIDALITTQAELIFSQDTAIQSLIRDSAKPMRSELPVSQSIWVAQLNHQLSFELGREGQQQAVELAKKAVCQILQIDKSEIQCELAHFWRYARSEQGQMPLGLIQNTQQGLIAGGDWSFGGAVQGAYQAAENITQQLLSQGHRSTVIEATTL
jgi:renalase